MIVSVPFAFQVRSLRGLVKLETELARRTARRAQVNVFRYSFSEAKRVFFNRFKLIFSLSDRYNIFTTD